MADLIINEYPSAAKVFAFFEDFSRVPRGSGNTAGIADYLVKFAIERKLEYKRDESDNVVIYKNATEGYESRPTVIIQGHTDIVADKIASSKKDLEKEGLELYRDGDFIREKETTLGADDGIALAYALALLDSSDIPHPRLEALFTSDEEIGLLGASALDASALCGRVMINIDSDEEGVFTVGCAGGLRMDLAFNEKAVDLTTNLYKIAVSGLMGGHSGVEINKGRVNAIKVLFEIVGSLSDMRIAQVHGGNADNAIPRDAQVLLSCENSIEDVRELASKLALKYGVADSGIKVTVERVSESSPVFSLDLSSKITEAIKALPTGVIAMEADMPDMVETSMNIGIIRSTESEVSISASLRSSKGAAKEALKARVRKIGESLSAVVSERGEYPEWEYKSDSHLRDVMERVYREQYGKAPSVVTIHAGLECGIFSKMIDGLDCVSIGPDNLDIHTPEERLSISSSARVWEFLKKVLKEI